MVKPNDGFGKANMVRLWVHESLRVFGDRLVDDSDREWFLVHLNQMVRVTRSCARLRCSWTVCKSRSRWDRYNLFFMASKDSPAGGWRERKRGCKGRVEGKWRIRFGRTHGTSLMFSRSKSRNDDLL